MQPTPITDTERAVLRSAGAMLNSPQEVIEEWALGLKSATLHRLPTFQTYCALSDVGPENDNNGVRSRAAELKVWIEVEILAPAARRARLEKRAEGRASGSVNGPATSHPDGRIEAHPSEGPPEIKPPPSGLSFGGHDPSEGNRYRWDMTPDETH